MSKNNKLNLIDFLNKKTESSKVSQNIQSSYVSPFGSINTNENDILFLLKNENILEKMPYVSLKEENEIIKQKYNKELIDEDEVGKLNLYYLMSKQQEEFLKLFYKNLLKQNCLKFEIENFSLDYDLLDSNQKLESVEKTDLLKDWYHDLLESAQKLEITEKTNLLKDFLEMSSVKNLDRNRMSISTDEYLDEIFENYYFQMLNYIFINILRSKHTFLKKENILKLESYFLETDEEKMLLMEEDELLRLQNISKTLQSFKCLPYEYFPLVEYVISNFALMIKNEMKEISTEARMGIIGIMINEMNCENGIYDHNTTKLMLLLFFPELSEINSFFLASKTENMNNLKDFYKWLTFIFSFDEEYLEINKNENFDDVKKLLEEKNEEKMFFNYTDQITMLFFEYFLYYIKKEIENYKDHIETLAEINKKLKLDFRKSLMEYKLNSEFEQYFKYIEKFKKMDFLVFKNMLHNFINIAKSELNTKDENKIKSFVINMVYDLFEKLFLFYKKENSEIMAFYFLGKMYVSGFDLNKEIKF